MALKVANEHSRLYVHQIDRRSNENHSLDPTNNDIARGHANHAYVFDENGYFVYVLSYVRTLAYLQLHGVRSKSLYIIREHVLLCPTE